MFAFSIMRCSLIDLGIVTTSFCKSQRKIICAVDLLYFSQCLVMLGYPVVVLALMVTKLQAGCYVLYRKRVTLLVLNVGGIPLG